MNFTRADYRISLGSFYQLECLLARQFFLLDNPRRGHPARLGLPLASVAEAVSRCSVRRLRFGRLPLRCERKHRQRRKQ